MAATGPTHHSELDDALIDAIATRLLDRVLTAMKEGGSASGLPPCHRHRQRTLAEASGSEGAAVDAVRSAFDGTEAESAPSNAIVCDVTS